MTITPHMTSIPMSAESTETVDDNLNDMFPSCITTRAQKSKECYSNDFYIIGTHSNNVLIWFTKRILSTVFLCPYNVCPK